MALSTSSLLLIVYVSCETVRANYAYYAFHTFPQISASLVALLSEITKLLVAFAFLLRANDGFTIDGLKKCVKHLRENGNFDFRKISKYALPAGLYLTNNLIYYTVLPNTSPSLLQVCILAKLPTTGILHHFMIKPQRNLYAWISLLCLCIGLVVFNVPSRSQGAIEGEPSWYLAPVAGFIIACLSALASIATETSTKTGEFWESQAYLYIWGIVFSMVAYPLAPSPSSSSPASTNLISFATAILGLALITSLTGLVVAVVLRARDNILKLVGTAASLMTIAISQWILLPGLRESTFTGWRVAGGGIVSVSTWCYNCYSQETLEKEKVPNDVEAEALLSSDEDLAHEKVLDNPQIGKTESYGQLFRPTPEKLICCVLLIGFATVEVAGRAT